MTDTKKTAHGFVSDAREGIALRGVTDVISFDERTVMLDTECGSMAVEGENLHITVLNIGDGKVEIEGKINGLYYYDSVSTPKRRLFGRKN